MSLWSGFDYFENDTPRRPKRVNISRFLSPYVANVEVAGIVVIVHLQLHCRHRFPLFSDFNDTSNTYFFFVIKQNVCTANREIIYAIFPLDGDGRKRLKNCFIRQLLTFDNWSHNRGQERSRRSWASSHTTAFAVSLIKTSWFLWIFHFIVWLVFYFVRGRGWKHLMDF